MEKDYLEWNMYLMYIQYLSSPTRPAKGGETSLGPHSLEGGEGGDGSVKHFAKKLSMHCLWGWGGDNGPRPLGSFQQACHHTIHVI